LVAGVQTPMSSEIIDSWSLPSPPAHVLTIPGLLAEQRAIGRTIGLIIDLSNHETLYAEDLAEQQGLQYAHIQVGMSLQSLLQVFCMPDLSRFHS
jgi:hypothetical protein